VVKSLNGTVELVDGLRFGTERRNHTIGQAAVAIA
jgi:hypothetical protein